MARLRPTYLGDDLFACQPVAEAVLASSGDFLFTAKPDSHKYPCWSRSFCFPKSVRFEEGIGEDNQLIADGSDGKFWGFFGIDKLLIVGLEVWVETYSDQSRHVEGFSDACPAAANESAASPAP